MKECLYLANQTATETLEFNEDERRRNAAIDVVPYTVSAQETIAQMHDDASEIPLEMLVEAAVIEELQKNKWSVWRMGLCITPGNCLAI